LQIDENWMRSARLPRATPILFWDGKPFGASVTNQPHFRSAFEHPSNLTDWANFDE